MAYNPPWMAELQAASWRGIPFFIQSINLKTGRKTAVHEYPYSDITYVEDLGLGPQVYAFEGFLLGDDAASQMEEFKRACEQKYEGELVHPRLGRQTVALISAGFGESAEAGNVVTLQLVFTVTIDPTASTATLSIGDRFSNFSDALNNISTASVGDFVKTAGAAVKSGQSAVAAVQTTAQGYVREVQGVVRDATRMVNAVKPVANLLGVSDRTFGRFLQPLRTVSNTVNSVAGTVGSVGRANAGVTSLLSGADKASALVTRAAAAVSSSAASQ